ncbi:hypothetical protein BJF90_34220 [Pseudonocardia sp. CNS-004]|nr:hypothetical protein BJF90_34220 [Pseudonocardia sp. CNS-004]
MVADELAELKEQLRSLVDGLVNVARVGRSLGVHLILATQKAAGVVDGQIRANTDLRVCLRVKEIGDSQDVIDAPDAAHLPSAYPGRALLVRGSGPPQLLQTARVTAPRRPGSETVRRAIALRWFDVAPPPPPAEAGGDDLTTDLNVLVDAVRAAAEADGLAPPYRPWLPPLPTALALDELAATRFAIPLGRWDRPQDQRQDVLEVPLGSGHVAIVGSGRSGRTTALRGAAVGLARAAGPGELHLHVVDGSGGLAGLDALPHTGVVVGPDDPERLERLLDRLTAIMRERRRDLSRLGAASVTELWSRDVADAPPHIVLLVDGWDGLVEHTEGASRTMLDLLAGGPAVGITVVLAGDERILKSRLLARLTHRLCLRLDNPTDATLVGLQVRNLPEDLPPGRALWAADGGQVQLPLLATDPSGPAQAAALADTAARLRADSEEPDAARAPLRLDRLPEQITLAEASALGSPPTTGRPVLLGVSGDRLSPVWAGLDAGPLVIAGPAGSGRSTAAATVAASAAASGLRVLLAAPRPSAAHGRAAGAGVTVVPSGELAEPLDRAPVDLVVLDDVDRLAPHDDLVERLTTPGAPALAVTGLLDSFGFGATGLSKVARTRPGSVVLLCPPNHLVAANVGVTLERGAGFSGPPGRAYLVAEGKPVLGQVPDLR